MDSGEGDGTDVRRAVLALAVVDDLDLAPGTRGVRLPSGVEVPWPHLRAALDGAAPGSAEARRRLRLELQVWELLAEPGRLRLLGRPSGPTVVGTPVLGGAVTLVLGVRAGSLLDPCVLAVPPRVRTVAGLSPSARDRARERLEHLGSLASGRLRRVPRVVEALGEADPLTLLCSATFRSALAAGCPTGLRALALPDLRRAWVDPRPEDVEFAPAVRELTDPEWRGFDRLLLVTPDEVALARATPPELVIDLRDEPADVRTAPRAPWARRAGRRPRRPAG
ncbi:hypothetical protein EV189_1287 [Motilibacter rhizosphaerae]|uniref:Uncharacterized protein n=1 Tax=Motilibacter rhizosphaerae TaxID=598652 RepID=A0A4Q7NRQ1_9ACTN|nr:hypothetical protein [Motilibacter rhizosphaerae]RZS89520.1 hypothetical protein EV189_1287 [Motilibacter rhizosphaerae]